MGHVGEEGRFGAAGGFGLFAGDAQGFLLFLHLGDVDAQADAAAIGRGVVIGADPAAIGEVLFVAFVRIVVPVLQALGQPFLFAPDGVGVLAMGQAIAQDILEPGAGLHSPGGQGIDVAVTLIAGQQTILPVEKHEAVGDRFNRGPDAHLLGDVDGKADHITIARAAVDEADVVAVGVFQDVGFGLVGVEALQDIPGPGFDRIIAKVEKAAGGQDRQHLVKADAGGDGLAAERREIGVVGRHQLEIGIKDRKAVLDRVDGIPQPPFGHDGGGMGLVEVLDEARVLAFQHLCLGQGRAGLFAMFDHLIGQRPRVQRQFFIRGKQLAAFLFQQPFRCQPKPSLFRKTFCQIHSTHPCPGPSAQGNRVQHPVKR